MEEYRAAIRSGLSRLLVVSGRDPLGQFWRFSSAVVAVLVILTPIAQLPMAIEFVRAFATSEQPEVSVPMLAPFPVLAVLAIGMLASAVCRRLHDTGLRGWWGVTVPR